MPWYVPSRAPVKWVRLLASNSVARRFDIVRMVSVAILSLLLGCRPKAMETPKPPDLKACTALGGPVCRWSTRPLLRSPPPGNLE